MTRKDVAVYGIYLTRPQVESAVEELKNAGFRSTDISVLFPDNPGDKEFAVVKTSKAPEGAAAGAGSGAVIGGGLAWLAGIGLMTIPGVGPFFAAGPIVAVLAGVGAGGVAGGIAGSLIGLGIPEFEANRYEGRIRNGGILLSVHAEDRDWRDKAKEILERTGAEDIASKRESRTDLNAADNPYPEGETAMSHTTPGNPRETSSGQPVGPWESDPRTPH